MAIPTQSGLVTDLYELTMAAGYFTEGFDGRASFELFVRSLPSQRNFLIAAGLAQAIEFLEGIRFLPDQLAYLRKHPAFQSIDPSFFDYLADFRFRGDVWAMPEGTACFPGEPLLRVTAPIAEAQIVETALLAAVSFQTMIASKAARVVESAAGRPVVEFGARRAHGIESGILAARAAFIGGCKGTSNAEAGHRFGIPTYGTQAHSWIMAHETEEEAFTRFLNIFPRFSVLLVDTYDVHGAIEKVIAMGRKPRGVRLDSGNLASDSIRVRRRLDEAGWGDVEIFMSGDLDEDRIASLLASGARVDTFGVGTSLSTSSDAPALGALYKLVEFERGGAVLKAAKFSAAKVTYPGRKQVYRLPGADREFERDLIVLEDERAPGGEPLLIPVMRQGRRIIPDVGVTQAQQRCREQMERLPAALRRLAPALVPYPVHHSERIEALLESVRERVVRTSPS